MRKPFTPATWLITLTTPILTTGFQGESSPMIQLTTSNTSSPDGSLPVDIASSHSSSNHSIVRDTTMVSNDNKPICDGPRYGFEMNVEDCLDALHKFARTTQRVTFAPRDGPISQPIYPLPWRWMGGEASCYFEPVLKPGADMGSASMYKIRDAASELTTKCASRKGEGGIVNNLGGDNNLALVMGRYEADEGSIRCAGSITKIDGCRDILLGMPATKQGEPFGAQVDPGLPGTGVRIPFTINAPDQSCFLKIFTTNRHGEADTTSWYKIWEAASAIYYACISIGSQGSVRGLGVNGELFISTNGA